MTFRPTGAAAGSIGTQIVTEIMKKAHITREIMTGTCRAQIIDIMTQIIITVTQIMIMDMMAIGGETEANLIIVGITILDIIMIKIEIIIVEIIITTKIETIKTIATVRIIINRQIGKTAITSEIIVHTGL